MCLYNYLLLKYPLPSRGGGGPWGRGVITPPYHILEGVNPLTLLLGHICVHLYANPCVKT